MMSSPEYDPQYVAMPLNQLSLEKVNRVAAGVRYLAATHDRHSSSSHTETEIERRQELAKLSRAEAIEVYECVKKEEVRLAEIFYMGTLRTPYKVSEVQS